MPNRHRRRPNSQRNVRIHIQFRLKHIVSIAIPNMPRLALVFDTKHPIVHHHGKQFLAGHKGHVRKELPPEPLKGDKGPVHKQHAKPLLQGRHPPLGGKLRIGAVIRGLNRGRIHRHRRLARIGTVLGPVANGRPRHVIDAHIGPPCPLGIRLDLEGLVLNHDRIAVQITVNGVDLEFPSHPPRLQRL